MIQKIVLITTAAAAAALCQPPPGQVPATATARIGLEMKQNADGLREYSHKRRTDVRIKGQSRGARVDLVRYVDGKQETIPLEAPARSGRAGGRRGLLRGLIAENKKKDMKEDVERLTALMRRYTSSGSFMARNMLEKASISRTASGPNAGLRAVATGVIEPSDSVTFTWSTAKRRPETIEIRTNIGADRVSATVEYASLPNGLFYTAHTLISWPKEEISIAVDTYDYTRDTSASSITTQRPSYD